MKYVSCGFSLLCSPPDLEPSVGGLTKVHVQALDEIISVNSFFTVAVFIGFSLTNPSAVDSLVGKCFVGADFTKYLLVFEVIAFSSYLLSSLIAQGLKLFIVILNTKDHAEVLSAQINPQVLRFGMLFTVIGTSVGTVFLTLSIVFFIQIRLGLLHCDNVWSKWATIPVVTMITGVLATFLFSSLFAFST